MYNVSKPIPLPTLRILLYCAFLFHYFLSKRYENSFRANSIKTWFLDDVTLRKSAFRFVLYVYVQFRKTRFPNENLANGLHTTDCENFCIIVTCFLTHYIEMTRFTTKIVQNVVKVRSNFFEKIYIFWLMLSNLLKFWYTCVKYRKTIWKFSSKTPKFEKNCWSTFQTSIA